MGQYWTRPVAQAAVEQPSQPEVSPTSEVVRPYESKFRTVKLPKFDMQAAADSQKTCAWAIIGKRNTGSTTLAEDVIRHKLNSLDGNEAASLMVFNCTQQYVPRYLEFEEHAKVTDVRTSSQYSEEVVHERVAEHKELHKTDNDRHLILVFDECFYDSRWKNSDGIREAVYNGGSLNISIILCLQYAMGLSIGIRNNLDYVAVFRDHTMTNRKRLYEYFFSACFDSSPIFDLVMKQVCEHPGDCLISDVAKSTAAWYRAAINPKPDQ